MNDQQIRTFFCIAYNEVNTVEEAMAMISRLQPKTEVILLQDSAKPASAALKRAVDATKGQVLRIRTSGVWNKLWKTIQLIELERTLSGKYCEAGEVHFISLIPAAEIHAAMKRHRVVANITNREAFWLKTLPFGEDHDDIIAMTLNTEMGYVTDKRYNDLSAFEAFELSAFEGLRFMRPCHDVQTCASIMAAYNPPARKGEKVPTPA